MNVCKASNETKVTAVDTSIFLLSKGGVTMCVAQHGCIVIVFDVFQYAGDGLPFTALVKTYEHDDKAYEKSMYLVGKLCKKDAISKYFWSHNYAEHLNNGDMDYASEKEVTDFIVATNSRVHEFLDKIVR